jgi:membrane-associated PAP2 superfamily phosphatase
MTDGASPTAARGAPAALWADLAVIVGGGVLLTGVSALLDLDRRVARAIMQLGSPLGDQAESAAAASVAICAAWLVVLAVPPLRRRWPLLARCGALFASTLLIAVLALIMSIKNEIDRPRPDETREFGGVNEYRGPFRSAPTCDCKAFPSSAAGFAFVIATPYFVLRRRWPALAWSILGAGLAWGGLVGYWRMVAGRHWLTDIAWAAVIVLAVASVLSHLSVRWRAE